MKDIFNVAPSLLVDGESGNFDELVCKIKNKTCRSLDAAIPVCRFRGTAIISTQDETQVIGWQRNHTEVQGMPPIHPAIISLSLDSNHRITDIGLDSQFSGSRGARCDHSYLNDRLKSLLTGRIMDRSLLKELNAGKLHCFHLAEILTGIVSALQLQSAHGLGFLSEEEVLDCVRDGNDLIVYGLHKFSHVPTPVHYAIVLENAMDAVRFDEKGKIFTMDGIKAVCYAGYREIYACRIDGMSWENIYLQIAGMCGHMLPVLKARFGADAANPFYCSGLSPQGFIGALVQAVAIKKYAKNPGIVMRCLQGLQRNSNAPLCIGAVSSQEEADRFFPGLTVV